MSVNVDLAIDFANRLSIIVDVRQFRHKKTLHLLVSRMAF